MKKYLFLLLSAAMFAFVGCTNDDLAGGTNNGTGEESSDVVYVDVAMSRPTATNTGTRSSTDWEDEQTPGAGDTNSNADPDYEHGYDYENDVTSVLIVIATTENEFIAYSAVTGITTTPADNPLKENFDFMANAKFKKSDIEAAYDGLLASGKTVRIFAYCNYPATLETKFAGLTANSGDTDWIDWEGTLGEEAGGNPTNSIWGKRSFLMTNARLKTATFPANKEDWNNYTTEGNPFHLSDNNEGGVDNRIHTDDGDPTESPIYVERTAARIDFRDASAGSDYTYNLTATGNAMVDGAVKANPNLIDIKLTGLSLVNMSKNYYFLRRVSNNGLKDDDYAGGTVYPASLWRVGALETKTNYVVDTDYEKKNTGYTVADARTAFNFPLYSADKITGRTKAGKDIYGYDTDAWYFSTVEQIAANDSDTWEKKEGNHGGEYHIWRYVTENTIPGTGNQKTVQSVGIVFKGKMISGADVEATTAVAGETPGSYVAGTSYLSAKVQEALGKSKDGATEYSYPVLYSIGGLLYADFDEVVAIAAKPENEGSTLDIAASNVLGYWYLKATAESEEAVQPGKFEYSETGEAPDTTDGEVVIQLTPAIYNEILTNTHEGEGKDWTGFTVDEVLTGHNSSTFKALVVAQNVTIYEAEADGYYCYYFYWNRHNDNGNNGQMGPMEFATVRNNVYKLAVTGLRRLGHPNDPENDPEPNIPDDPDEEDVVYIDVKIEVLPWVVRVNDIVF